MESELNNGIEVEDALGQKRSAFPETWKALNSWIWHHFFKLSVVLKLVSLLTGQSPLVKL